jgi:predicted MFS family arabinose efflux permease
MISALFPPEKRARMFGIWQSAIPLGSALGVALGGFIAATFGWRHALGIVAIPGFLIAIMFFWVKDYKTVELVKSVPSENALSKAKMNLRDIFGEFFRSKSLIMVNLAFAACAFTTVALTSWLPSYFQRFEGMPVEKAGLMASVVMLLAVVGAPVGGLLTDQWFKKQAKARMLLPAITTSLSAVFLFVALFLLHGNVLMGMLLAVGVTIIMFAPGAVAVTQDVVHPGLRSTSLSICIVVQHLLGSALGPWPSGAFRSVRTGQSNAGASAFLLLAGSSSRLIPLRRTWEKRRRCK